MIIRCSTHDAEHARWVVEQARLGELDKEKVGALLCEQDNGGGVLMFLLDFFVLKISDEIMALLLGVLLCSMVFAEFPGDFCFL